MVKQILLFLVIFSQYGLAAPNSRNIEPSSIVNGWVQAGLRVTERVFDLAIQGHGFFTLVSPDGQRSYSRYGEFILDDEGYLSLVSTRFRLMGYHEGSLVPINLNDASKNFSNAVIRNFYVDGDGTIVGLYNDGEKLNVGKIALTVFSNPRLLDKKGEHLLFSNLQTGEPLTDAPMLGNRGMIFSATLEVLDDYIYKINLRKGRGTRISEILLSSADADREWYKVKTKYYIYELHLTEDEFTKIEDISDRFQRARSRLPLDSGDANKLEDLNKNEESLLTELLGSDRFGKIKALRKSFNETAGFGAEYLVTSF